MQNSSAIKIPLTARFKAWWEGYDLEDIEARLRAAEGQHPAAQNPQGTGQADNSPRRDLETLPWDETRVHISQFIWGEGYCGPGGPEHIIGLSKLLTLSPEMSMMVLGAGLGGPARVLAHEFGAWVTGFEASEELAKKGMELSTMHGMAKKAPILHYNAELPDPFDRNFDRAFLKDTLFTVANKPDLLRKISKKLKDDSLVLTTDYVMKSATFRDKPEYSEWKSQEPLTPYLFTHEEEIELFDSTGFNVRVNEDISEHYVELITQAWSQVDAVITELMKQGEQGKVMIQALLQEAEFWSIRAKLLESGDLQLCRILASKKPDKSAPIR